MELPEMTRTPLGFCQRMVRELGDVCAVPIPGAQNFMVHDVDVLQRVFVDEASSFKKSRLYQAMRKVIGIGLLTNDGEAHLQQRRLVAPAFHRARVQEYAAAMVENTINEIERWQPGRSIDVQEEMSAITIRIITQTMFSSRVGEGELREMGKLVNDLLEAAAGVFQNPFTLLCFENNIPLPSVQRIHSLTKQVDERIKDIIASYRKVDTAQQTDLLSMLMNARDEETGAAMDDKQIRDEVITMFMAGHETTATALMWMWYVLSTNEQHRENAEREIDAVMQSRLPHADDYPALSVMRNILKETLRLYPPVWTFAREPLHDVEILGYRFPKGSVVCTITPILHHKEKFFTNAEEFLPERWNDPAMKSLPRFAYVPFGAGNRMCIGEGFAWMEAMMIASSIIQRYRLVANEPIDARVRPLFTLRMQVPLRLVVEKR
jgi:cytochrome P450